MASTTSTEDSGLFDVLIPAFEAANPEYDLQYTAVGSGQALELGRRDDVDVLLVHAPEAESTFIARGHGVARCAVMYNDYVLLGPRSGAARGSIRPALRRIARSQAAFTSRGDDSGTHRRERKLWAEAGVAPSGSWYMEVGQGMAQTLQVASEKQAYTLSDRSTYLNMREALDLEVVVEGDPGLLNQYSVIPVAGASNSEGAAAFARWVTGTQAQQRIGTYGAERFGNALFTPNANGCDL